MANLIWTGILYFSTSMIVYIVYRTFMNDRRAENERKTSEVVMRNQGRKLEPAPPRVRRPAAAAAAPVRAPAAAAR